MKPLVEVENLVVRPDFRKPFKGKTWVSLFHDDRVRALRTAARAVLLTLVQEGSPKGGLLRVHRSSLRNLYYGRNRVNEALRELRNAELVWRTGEWILVSPELAYSGPANEYFRALEAWKQLQLTTEQEEAEG